VGEEQGQSDCGDRLAWRFRAGAIHHPVAGGKEMFIVYHTHADAEKPSGDRVVNIDRLYFDEAGNLKIKGPTRPPQPLPSGCH
jgi:hypothetical protein